MKHCLLLMMVTFSSFTWAADSAIGEIEKQALNVPAVVMFLMFVSATLGITYWAAKKMKSTSDYYAAGGGITGFQNGLAIAGDYMSAASFLGISGLVYLSGYDGLIYSIGFLIGWPLILFIVAERLRNLGRYTFADVASYRLAQFPIRTLSAFGTLAVVALYLIAQMVGAGKLIQLLFGLPKFKEGRWFGLHGLKASGLRLPLEGRDLDEFLALEYGKELLVPLGLYSCGNRSRIGNEELRDIGLLELKADVEFGLGNDSNNSPLVFSIKVNLHELGQTQMTLVLPSTTLGNDASDVDVSTLSLASIRLQHIEKGYFRRLGNFCMHETGIHDRKTFAHKASNEWLTAMENIGILFATSEVTSLRTLLLKVSFDCLQD